MKFLQYIGILALSLLIPSCNSGSDVSDGSDSGSSAVTVSIGERSGGGSAELSPELFPAEIISFRFTVTGPNMDPMEQIVNVVGTNPITVIFIVPNGYRCFSIYASNAPNGEGTVLYSGVTCQDIGGGPETVTVFMQLQLVCDLYVDVETGDDDNDGSMGNPFETIQNALSVAGEMTKPVSICVAPGRYYTDGGYGYGGVGGNEWFPLRIEDEVSIFCTGNNHSTVVDAVDSWSSAFFVSHFNTVIDGCRIIPSEYETAIEGDSGSLGDSSNILTVNNVLIEGLPGSNGSTGMYLMGYTAVTNSVISGMVDDCWGGTGIEINSASPVSILGSQISGNSLGIKSWNSSPAITGSDIFGNNLGIEVQNGNPLVNNNRIYCNTLGMDVDSSTQINAQLNRWNNAPPDVAEWGVCAGTEDTCYSDGGSGWSPPDTSGYGSAVTGTCPGVPPLPEC